MFWLKADPVKLDSRLDARVDMMINRGLVKELTEMRDQCLNGLAYGSAKGKPLDYTRGILQSIGFKEFHDFLESCGDSNERSIKFEQAVENMKLATRQYCRKQTNWLKNRLLKQSIACSDDSINTFVLDASGMRKQLISRTK